MSFKEEYEQGFPIFEKLFNMQKEELLKVLKEIVGKKYFDILDNNPTIRKEIIDEVPAMLTLDYYNRLCVNASGIFYKPEVGGSNKIITFNKFFKLD